jgi:hypothetical protein
MAAREGWSYDSVHNGLDDVGGHLDDNNNMMDPTDGSPLEVVRFNEPEFNVHDGHMTN